MLTSLIASRRRSRSLPVSRAPTATAIAGDAVASASADASAFRTPTASESADVIYGSGPPGLGSVAVRGTRRGRFALSSGVLSAPT